MSVDATIDELIRRVAALQAALSVLEQRMQQFESSTLTETGLANILRESYWLTPKRCEGGCYDLTGMGPASGD